MNKFSILTGGMSHVFSSEYMPADPAEARKNAAYILRNFVHANDPKVQEVLRERRMENLKKTSEDGEYLLVASSLLDARDIHTQYETNVASESRNNLAAAQGFEEFEYNPDLGPPTSPFVANASTNSVFKVNTRSLYIPTIPTTFDMAILNAIASLVSDARNMFDGEAFVKFCTAMSQAETPVKLQTMVRNRLQPYCFLPLSSDSELVSSYLISAYGEHLLAKLALKNSFVVDTTAFVSSDVWADAGIDPGSQDIPGTALTHRCKQYVTNARAVLKFSEVASRSRIPNTCINRVHDSKVRHVFFPMCIKHEDPGEVDHWVLVVVYIERTPRSFKTHICQYKPIRCLHVVVFDPWSSARSPYIKQDKLINAARLAVDFLYQIEEIVMNRSRNNYTYAVRIARGGQDSGTTCGLWVMAAMKALIDGLFPKKSWNDATGTVKLEVLLHTLSRIDLTAEWRSNVMHDMATTAVELFANFPLVQLLRSPFQKIVDDAAAAKAAKEEERRRQARDLALLREQYKKLSTSGRATRGPVAIPQIPQSLIAQHGAKSQPRRRTHSKAPPPTPAASAASTMAKGSDPAFFPGSKRKRDGKAESWQRKAAKGLMAKVVHTHRSETNGGVDLDGIAL